tara:strand:+ start:1202 stop:1573 length:372 start_codon:yes stop_codon:yes gene_type:complete
MIRLIYPFLSGILLLYGQESKSEGIHLKCTGKFELNRGALIKPDWEISYLTINKNGLRSIVKNGGVKKEGRTLIRPNTYIITHRDNRNKIKSKYIINKIYNTYKVDYPQTNRVLIGTCQKGRG